MASADISPEQIEAAAAALAHGRALYVKGEMQNAAEALSAALGQFVALYGELGVECGEAYYYYGLVLLALAREENAVLAAKQSEEGAAKDSEDDESDDGDDDADDAEEKPAEQQDAEGSEPLAWQVLDLARVIFTKKGEAGRARLADTHSAIGEYLMEQNQFEEAIKELETSLSLWHEEAPASRQEGEAEFMLAIAHHNAKHFVEAEKHTEAAISIVENHKILLTRTATEADLAAQRHRREGNTQLADKEAEQATSQGEEAARLAGVLDELRASLADIREEKRLTAAAARDLANAMPTIPSERENPAAADAPAAAAAAAAGPATDLSGTLKRKPKAPAGPAAGDEKRSKPDTA